MRTQEHKLLEGVTGTGAGDAKTVSRVDLGAVQVTGISVATVAIEGSIDGTNYEQIGNDITSDEIRQITDIVRHIRANVTAHTAGTINATYIGQEHE